jgi:uncharacterized protein YoxC
MTAETIAFVLALAFAAQTVVVCVVLLRLVPVLREVNEMIGELRDVMKKVDVLSRNLESASSGVQQVEHRVRGIVTRILDEIEPPVRRLASLATGVRVTVGTLLRRPITGGNGVPPPAVTERGVRR